MAFGSHTNLHPAREWVIFPLALASCRFSLIHLESRHTHAHGDETLIYWRLKCFMSVTQLYFI